MMGVNRRKCLEYRSGRGARKKAVGGRFLHLNTSWWQTAVFVVYSEG